MTGSDDDNKDKAWVMKNDRLTKAKVRDDVRLQKVYTTAKEELMRYGYIEFKRLLKLAGVMYDTDGVVTVLPTLRKFLVAELRCELMPATQLYFEDLKKAEYAVDGHGRKWEASKYLALNTKARGWISVGRDVDGDLVERYLLRCKATEQGWHRRQVRIRRERAVALRAPAPASDASAKSLQE
jgi:hypothetical protein